MQSGGRNTRIAYLHKNTNLFSPTFKYQQNVRKVWKVKVFILQEILPLTGKYRSIILLILVHQCVNSFILLSLVELVLIALYAEM